MDELKRVIVRDWRGRPHVRVLLEVSDGAVFVCNDDRLAAIQRGEQATPMVGVPIEDVFLCDSDAEATLRSSGQLDWDVLTPLRSPAL